MTYERILSEASEEIHKLVGLIAKLKEAKRGSETYYRLVPQIAVAATVVSAKGESIARMTDELEDAMPDED